MKIKNLLALIGSLIALVAIGTVGVLVVSRISKSKDNGKTLAVESIEVVGSIKSTYYVGDLLDLNNAKLKVVYEDESSKQVDLTVSMVSGFSSTVAGTFNLTIIYEQKSITQPYTILEKQVTGIDLVGQIKSTYFVGDELDLNNAQLKVVYNNNTEEEISILSSMISNFDTSTAGTYSLTISYAGKTISKNYTVKQKQAVSIELVGDIQTKYVLNQDLYLNEAQLRVSYNDNSSELVDLTASMVSGFNSAVAGTFNLTISYAGQTITKSYTVTEQQIEYIGNYVVDYDYGVYNCYTVTENAGSEYGEKGEHRDKDSFDVYDEYAGNHYREEYYLQLNSDNFIFSRTRNFYIYDGDCPESFSLYGNFTIDKNVIRGHAFNDDGRDNNTEMIFTIYENYIECKCILPYETQEIVNQYILMRFVKTDKSSNIGNYIIDYDYAIKGHYEITDSSAGEVGEHDFTDNCISQDGETTYRKELLFEIYENYFAFIQRNINLSNNSITGNEFRGTFTREGNTIVSKELWKFAYKQENGPKVTGEYKFTFTINDDYIECKFEDLQSDTYAQYYEICRFIKLKKLLVTQKDFSIEDAVGMYDASRNYGRDVYSKTNGSFVKQGNESFDWYDEDDQNDYSMYWILEINHDYTFTLTWTTITNNDESTKVVYVYTGTLTLDAENKVLSTSSCNLSQDGSTAFAYNKLMTFTFENNYVTWFRFYSGSTEKTSDAYNLYKFISR